MPPYVPFILCLAYRGIAMKLRPYHICSLLLCALSQSACSVIDADPAEDSGYVQTPEAMRPWPERAAFLQRSWFKNQKEHYATRDRFTKIHFRPTRTDFLKDPGWWDTLNAAGQTEYASDAREMAAFIDRTLYETFTQDPDKRFAVVEQKDESTVVYEFAIVELRPTKVVANTAGTALGVLVPGGGMVKSVAKGSIAVEVTARDGKNDELLLAWADREIDRASIFSFRDFSTYGHERETIRSWAEDLLSAWKTPDTQVIADPLPVTLNPF